MRKKNKETLDFWSILKDREARYGEPRAPYVQRLPNCDATTLNKCGFQCPVLVSKDLARINTKLNLDNILSSIGDKEEVPVIDSDHQRHCREKWTMRRWAEYFRLPQKERKRTLNIISFEFSHTRLGEVISPPETVEHIDWIEKVWPRERKASGDYPKVQRFLLMSAAGSFLNFHLDFGGSSVWYNVVRGKKIFLLIPPTERNLERYKEWHDAVDYDEIFFGDWADCVIKCELPEGHTLLIPSAWIHAVYTPEDSIVLGGNFLHSFNMELQIKSYEIEEETKTPEQFRFPFFEQLQWYCAENYAKLFLENKKATITDDEKQGLYAMIEWLKYYKHEIPEGFSKHPNYIISVIDSYLHDRPFPDVRQYKAFDKSTVGLCICGKGERYAGLWVACDECGDWFHGECVGVTEEQAQSANFYCDKCKRRAVLPKKRKMKDMLNQPIPKFQKSENEPTSN